MAKVTARKLSVAELEEKVEEMEARRDDFKIRLQIVEGKLHLLNKRKERAENEAKTKTPAPKK